MHHVSICAPCRVTDMLRFHKFTIGHAWMTEYGDPDKEEDYKWLRRYSPLHTLADMCTEKSEHAQGVEGAQGAQGVQQQGVQYPATLLLTADHDDRVSPLHSFKFIAQLQHLFAARSAHTQPLLIRIETKAGHGMGKPTIKTVSKTQLTFLTLSLTPPSVSLLFLFLSFILSSYFWNISPNRLYLITHSIFTNKKLFYENFLFIKLT